MLELNRIYGLQVNLLNVRQFKTTIRFKQYDYKSSYIILQYTRGEEVIENIVENNIVGIFRDSTGQTILDNVKNPVKSYATIEEGNNSVVYLEIPDEVISLKGDIICETVILTPNGKRITAPAFIFSIESSIMDFNLSE